MKLLKVKSDYKRNLSLFALIAATLTAQLYNLGMCQKGPVVAVGLVCGNALINASMQQDGFDSIVSGVYGISCVAYSTMTLVTSVIFIDITKLSHDDLGYYLLAWSWINLIFALRSYHKDRIVQSIYFALVFIGSIMEVIGNLTHIPIGKLSNYIILFALAFPTYEMTMGIVYEDELSSNFKQEESSTDVLVEIAEAPVLNNIFSPI